MSSFRTGNPRFRPTSPGPFQENTPPPLQTETRPLEKNQKRRQNVAPVFVVPFVGCALTKAQHPAARRIFRRKRSEPPSHQENPPRTRKHPSSANQMQPPFKPSSRKENSFSSPPLLLSRLCLAAFPPFGPWSRQRNLKRFPFRGQTRGSPLSRFQATQPRARSRTPSSSPAFHRPP